MIVTPSDRDNSQGKLAQRERDSPRGAFLLHSRLASSSEARSYDVNGICFVCKMRKRYSVARVSLERERVDCLNQIELDGLYLGVGVG
jgi:hypothetical protein